MVKTRRALLIVVAFLALTAASCPHAQTTTVKLAVATELSLGTLQDASRHLCDPAIAAPTPIVACVEPGVSLGMTTAKFRQISAALAKAFDFMHDTLVPALKIWQPGQPAPSSLADFAKLVDDVVAVARTITHNAQAQAVFDAIALLTAALASLNHQLGVA